MQRLKQHCEIGHLLQGHSVALHALCAQSMIPATPKSESILSPTITLQCGRPARQNLQTVLLVSVDGTHQLTGAAACLQLELLVRLSLQPVYYASH